ncbi:MAG: TlpA disulfide reductase family protein [Thermodesulfovibrionales bacterium]|nr:TlpA disulfide reductase family protein [Thermodesulfovibrionales bacterium]
MKNKSILLISILMAALAVLFFATRSDHNIPETVSIGETVPDFELIDVKNRTMKLSDLRGSIVLVNFWATWCESCIDEMPSLENLQKNLSGETSFRIVTVLFKDNLPRATDYLRDNRYTLPVYANPDGSAARNFGLTGVPETYLIDKKGILREKVIGPADWNSPRVVQIIRAFMNEPG